MLNSLALLPLEEEKLNEAIASAVITLVSRGLTAEESRLKLEAVFEDWLDKDGKAEVLPLEIRPLLAGASWADRTTKTPHTNYVELLRKLEGKYTGNRREAAILVSRLPFILSLAEEFNCSPPRIAYLLTPAHTTNPISWKAIRKILEQFKISYKLDTEKIKDLIERERLAQEVEFADASVRTLVEIFAAESAAFGLGTDFDQAISNLFAPSGGDPFVPYLQMLLYVAVSNHFFDHPSEFISTFEPRGGPGNQICGVFPSQLAPGGNPMLNNSKAINKLTLDWADARDTANDLAKCLVRVVYGLSSLPYPARKKLSATIRRGILRFIEIQTPAQMTIPEVTGIDDAWKFLRAVVAAPTNTKGIIEQRVTDFLGVMTHQESAWRARGLGDPVNASNTSSRKLGDCDFQNAATQQCHAVEAHAGRLTDVYLHEHLRTLRLNLPKRLDEWSGISEISEWKLEVLFIAPENALSTDHLTPALGIPCDLKVTTFHEACDHALEMASSMQEKAVEIFNRWVVRPLNAPNTPHSVKHKALEMMESR